MVSKERDWMLGCGPSSGEGEVWGRWPSRTHHTDSLHGEEHSAEVEREHGDGCEGLSLTERWNVREDVVGDDSEADDSQDVAQGAEGSQLLEVAHRVDEQEGQQQDQHVHS